MPERCGGSQTFVPRMVSYRVSMDFIFYAERELLAGYYQNKHSTKLIAKIKLDLKSQKYFKDEASREHVYCFVCVCVCASYSKHEQT